MPIYWSIKTLIDFGGFHFKNKVIGTSARELGCIKGTGVFKNYQVGYCPEEEMTENTEWHQDSNKSQTDIKPPTNDK